MHSQSCTIHNFAKLKSFGISILEFQIFFGHFNATPIDNHKMWYKEEIADSSQVWVVVNLVKS